MKVLIFRKFASIALITISGMIFLMTISGCKSTEVVFRTGPDGKYSKQERPPSRKNGPPPWAPAHGYRAKNRYRYYPSSQVYYDENRGNYIYYNNGKWEVSVSLPNRIHINLTDHVTLEMDTDQPYKYHSEVTDKYPPGQLKKKKGKGKGKKKSKW